MSFRGPDNNLSQYLRGVEDKTTALQKGVGQARQNTVHLGGWVIEAEGDKKLKMTNLATGETTYVGDQYIPFVASKEWSWTGTVNPAEDTVAPALITPHELTVTHCVIHFNVIVPTVPYTIYTKIGTSTAAEIEHNADLATTIFQMDLTVPENGKLYPVVAANPTGDGSEMSITYWYTGVYQGELD